MKVDQYGQVHYSIKEILEILNNKTNLSCTIPEKKVKKGFFQRLFGW